CQHGYVTPFTF
nr:immunoglobulin light chain junction region [Macaca mulatta]MPN81604.1 immunoglobulin light chain junction region [Macaca mulatta]MPN81663.1 immunoglobulin light chain junction region [Macaca mulatta]MPN81737.1 immunoglobulin light chain junction region [Macaca mulatta]MPN81756.1 immunoglobulin light chain junction region [Macaca mulatta]